MPVVAGVDGARANWFMVWQDSNGKISSACAGTSAAVCQALALADVIAVDVPIGLTDRGPRLCDQQARKALRAPRASSVFSPPIRPVLRSETREEASSAQKQIDGRGIGAQAWGIFPKICEWDSYLRAHREIAKRILEVHPEISFWALNAFRPMQFGKKSADGRRERRELLAREFGMNELEAVRSRHRRREVADDDLHDAFVALWTARRIHGGLAKCLPETPEDDSQRLPMAIWY